MKIDFFNEPLLNFGNDSHICPRFGISNFEVFDSKLSTKPKDINLGIIGTRKNFESFEKWIKLCSDYIPEKVSNQSNLFTSFCGFNEYVGFRAKMVYDETYFRPINDTEIKELTKISNQKKGILESANLYLRHIEYLAQIKNPKVIICIIPDLLWNKVLKVDKIEEIDKSELDKIEEDEIEINFRSYLKAKSMQFKIPIQLIRERSLSVEKTKPTKSELQDLATRAWNFSVAIYYKAGGTPWKATNQNNDKHTCFVGISFFRTRDKKTLQTSLAQVFDEQGKGVILRGNPAQVERFDRQPHLTEKEAYLLLSNAILSYHFAEGVFPKRIVIHKSSIYTEQEIEGFEKAIIEKSISTFDLVTIYESDIRLFRLGNYPPLRGTSLELCENQYLLYTKSSIDYYKTYAGMYIPQPIEIRLTEPNSSPRQICEEIFSLTKMNWNKTQFDGKMPITIDCSRSVGSIMKYLNQYEKPEIKYSFYM
jgi:hypothetical protein